MELLIIGIAHDYVVCDYHAPSLFDRIHGHAFACVFVDLVFLSHFFRKSLVAGTRTWAVRLAQLGNGS